MKTINIYSVVQFNSKHRVVRSETFTNYRKARKVANVAREFIRPNKTYASMAIKTILLTKNQVLRTY